MNLIDLENWWNLETEILNLLKLLIYTDLNEQVKIF